MTNLMVFSGFILTWMIQLGLTIAVMEKIEDKRKWDSNNSNRY